MHTPISLLLAEYGVSWLGCSTIEVLVVRRYATSFRSITADPPIGFEAEFPSSLAHMYTVPTTRVTNDQALHDIGFLNLNISLDS